MNKLSIVFIAIIIFLLIAIGISVKYLISSYENNLISDTQAHFFIQAVENAGFDVKRQEDGSYKLIEKDERANFTFQIAENAGFKVEKQEDGSIKLIEK